MRMLCGKYSGVEIQNLPDFYLTWLAILNLVNPGLRKAIHAELRRRECNELNLALHTEDAGLLLQAIEAGRQVLTLNLGDQRRLDTIVEALQEASLRTV